ncbi:MAG: NGG1p interacting factor NIF3 [Elusimicrobiota bacterium]
MKIKDIMDTAVREGIAEDVRTKQKIDKLLKQKKEEYQNLEGTEKEIFDRHSIESPYADSRIIYGDPETEVEQAWVGIDTDTSELLMIKHAAGNMEKIPVVISHHPLGRAYPNFYEVMDLQADLLREAGVTISVAENLTRKRKAEVARRLSAVNHFKAQDAARILDINTMNIHTPADNHVTNYVKQLMENEDPETLEDMVDLLLEIPEYKIAAKRGNPPEILNGNKKNKCGKFYIDMTGGTENNPDLIKELVNRGISTVVGMHLSEKHYKKAQKANLNVIIAGHISSDNLGLNLLLDKIIDEHGDLEIKEYSGFTRVERNG